MSNAYGEGQNTRTENEQVGPDDVVITIKGPKAARMIDRADSEARIREEILRALGPKLDSIEAAAARRAEEQEARLSQAVQQLHEKMDEAAQLREDVRRLRQDLADQSYKFSILQEKVRNIATVAPQPEPPSDAGGDSHTQGQTGFDGHAGTTANGADTSYRAEGADSPRSQSSNGLGASWFKRVNFGFALWTTALAVAAAAVAGAVWIIA